jgi:hypothetical protein
VTDRLGLILTVLIAVASGPVARGGIEATAEAGATVQPGGPRGGVPAKTYLNVEGKNNGRESAYASFGVLDFRPAKPEKPVAKVKGLTLTLVESIAQFSKAGAIRVYLATDTTTGLDRDRSPLKFDTKTPGGVGDQLKTLLPLGAAAFVKRKTGEVDAIILNPEGESETYLRGQLNGGGTLRLVIVPADDDVAATYFGAGCEPVANRPKLGIEAAP